MLVDLVQFMAGTNPLLLAFAVLIFDIPRYTLSLVSLAIFGVWRSGAKAPAAKFTVSVILPTFNGGGGLMPSIAQVEAGQSKCPAYGAELEFFSVLHYMICAYIGPQYDFASAGDKYVPEMPA